ncbi:MAG TPA: ABC transporter ATP-binding protein, partial [Anaerolineae bacterium]
MKTILLYIRYLLPYWRELLFSLLLIGFGVTLDMVGPWPLKIILDDVIKGSNPQHLTALDRLAVSMTGGNRWTLLYLTIGMSVFFALFDAWVTYGLASWTSIIGQKVVSDLRMVLYTHLNRLSLSFHDKRHTGDLIARIMGDIDSIRDLMVSGFADLISNSLSLFALSAVMLWLNWQLALLTLAIAPVLFLLVYYYSRRIKRAARQARRKEGGVTSVVHESLAAMPLVQAFAREEFEEMRFNRENQATTLANLDTVLLQAQFSPLVNLLIALGSAGVMLYAAAQVLDGALSVGSIVLFTAYLRAIYAPIRQLAKLSGSFSRALASGERIEELLRVQSTVRDKPGALRIDRLNGRIKFDHVNFAYEPGFTVLEDICFEVEPGQKVALVGSTGSGKTSIVSLVPRFYDPTAGRVLVEGRDVRDLTLTSLRNQISLVLQESLLFNMSVRDNIAYGKLEATQDEIIAAAKAANAHHFILALPQGYDTIIGEGGDLLSGGQRQRIAIARAMIRNAPILILDEPTTALDAESEHLALQALEHLQRGRTTLVVAHRLASIQDADLILVIERGRIIERGTHKQLLAHNGRYSELYGLQVPIADLGRWDH